MKINEIKYGDEIGRTTNPRGKYKLCPCVSCGKPRWTRWLVEAKNILNKRCIQCAYLERDTKGDKNPRWMGDNISAKSGRLRARKIYPKQDCELCGSTKTERHHKDGDTLNNHHSNIQFLCRRCHMKVDGRLEVVRKRAIEYCEMVKRKRWDE